MKKIVKQTLAVSTLFSIVILSQKVFADTNTVAKTNASVGVSGTLGADNTHDDALIPEGDNSWINVTTPTATIFYNTPDDLTIKSPNYTITNNSARPVKVSATGFTNKGTNPNVPSDFSLALKLSGTGTNPATSPSTNLIQSGVVANSLNANLITLASKDGLLTGNGVGQPGDNKCNFTYDGQSSTPANMIRVQYNLDLTFSAVSW